MGLFVCLDIYVAVLIVIAFFNYFFLLLWTTKLQTNWGANELARPYVILHQGSKETLWDVSSQRITHAPCSHIHTTTSSKFCLFLISEDLNSKFFNLAPTSSEGERLRLSMSITFFSEMLYPPSVTSQTAIACELQTQQNLTSGLKLTSSWFSLLC